MDEKRFDEWIEVKKIRHDSARLPVIKDGEIWWCAMGENIGVEINGKSESFARPVLVFKKLSRFGFMGVPLTSKEHDGNWYVSFIFRDKKQTATLAQARVMSVSRLYKKMGDVTRGDFAKVREGFGRLYLELGQKISPDTTISRSRGCAGGVPNMILL